MRYSLDEKVINPILAYLGERPFKEVTQMITALHQDAKPVPEITDDKPQPPVARVVKETEVATVDEGDIPDAREVNPENKEPNTNG